MVHIRKYVEEHSILELLIGFHKSFYAEYEEAVIGDIGVSVEEFAFSSYAHGVKSEAQLAQKLLGKERVRAFLILLVFALNDLIKVFHGGIVRRLQPVVIGIIVYAVLFV